MQEFGCLKLYTTFVINTSNKKWQIQSLEDEAVVTRSNIRILRDSRFKIGFTADIPKSGFESMNDENMSRFRIKIASEIDVGLIYKLKVI